MTDTDRLAALQELTELCEQAWFSGANDAPDLWGTFAAYLTDHGVTLQPAAPADGLKPTLPPPDPRLVGTEYRPLYPAAPDEME